MNEQTCFPERGFDESVEQFCASLHPNNHRVQMLNVTRYSEMMIARKALRQLIETSGYPAEIVTKFDPASSCVSVTVTTDYLAVTDKRLFATVLKFADNFDVSPMLNGEADISFVFYHMMIPMK